MRLEIKRPVKTLKILNDFENTRKILNEFSCEENVVNFLNNNRNNYSNERKLDVVINNIEKNALFLFPDYLKNDIFGYMENHNSKRILSENNLYKLYLYFTGTIEETRVKNLLERYSEPGFKLDFEGFVDKNIDTLFTKCDFPEYLVGEYPAMEELIPLLSNDIKNFSKLDRWQDNILSYLYSGKVSKEDLNKINFGVLHSLDNKIYRFFRRNKNVTIKRIYINYVKKDSLLYKQYNLDLTHGDCLSVYGKFTRNRNVVRKEFYLEDLSMFYYKKGGQQDKKGNNKSVAISKINLIKLLENKYKLNKFYCIPVKVISFINEKIKVIHNIITDEKF